ncbi:MAG: hypothetical protein R3B07_24820 [Polyangiaceae bacterium]
MENRPKKRRLGLLPEVLPAPPPPGKLNPRERTLKSLGRLAAAAAAAASLSACKETGCGSSGYAVVDPMPPPAQCEGLVATISAVTGWDPSGNIKLRLSKPTMAGATYKLPGATDAGADAQAAPSASAAPGASPSASATPSASAAPSAAPSASTASPNAGSDASTGSDAGAATGPVASAIRVQHGILISVTDSGGGLVLEIKPDAGATYVAVEVPAACPAGMETVLAEIRINPGMPKPTLSVALYDQQRY